MTAVQIVWFVVGLILIVVVFFYDLFQSVVLPRPAVRKVQLARAIVGWTQERAAAALS